MLTLNKFRILQPKLNDAVPRKFGMPHFDDHLERSLTLISTPMNASRAGAATPEPVETMEVKEIIESKTLYT
jgi:hypothetical protein